MGFFFFNIKLHEMLVNFGDESLVGHIVYKYFLTELFVFLIIKL